MNHILSALPDDFRDRFVDTLSQVELKAGQKLELPNQKIESLFFIESGVTAVVAISEGEQLATALIGCEGVTGSSLLLGDTHSPNLTIMLTNGTALRADTTAIIGAMDQPDIRRLFSRYLIAFFNQAEHTALSNALTTISQRVARWILMTHDRVSHDVIAMSHETISLMLGTRRAGITTALQELHNKGLIRVDRGSVRVIDRVGLESAAGHFYGIPEREFRRLVNNAWPSLT